MVFVGAVRTMKKGKPAEGPARRGLLVLATAPVHTSCLLVFVLQGTEHVLWAEWEVGGRKQPAIPRGPDASLDRLAKNLFTTAVFPGLLNEGPRTSRSWGHGFPFTSCQASMDTVWALQLKAGSHSPIPDLFLE